MDYRILAPIVIGIALVSSFTAFYVVDLEQQLRNEQSRYIPERLVFVDGQLSEFFEGTNELKKFS